MKDFVWRISNSVVERKLLVDADACPVKQEISELTELYDIRSIFVASYRHLSDRQTGEWIYVDPDPEAVDLYIASHVSKGDIVITWDMGLAAMLTNRHVYVLTPSGKVIKDEDIPTILYGRYLGKKERAQGKRTRGPKPFTDKDREEFSKALSKLLTI